ncbi:MAG: ketopantoate reductase family protein [Anaerolineales bacterium]
MAVVTILGTGAMALYFGSRLARVGVEVRLLGSWEEGLAAVNRSGICVQEGADRACFPALAAADESLFAPIELVLVLVKSWQTSRAAKQLSRALSPQGIALTLQNGLGNAEILREALGQERTAQGVTTYGATCLGPGLVRPGGEGTISVQQHPRLAPLVEMLRDAGLVVQEVNDLSSLVWGKLVINVGINPLTALLEVNNGHLLHSPDAVAVMVQAAEEAAELAARQGIELDFSDPGESVKSVARVTSQNLSSMLQDIQRGAPTEIEALCGEVVRRGASIGLPAPTNQLLYQLVKAKVELHREFKDDNSHHIK